MQDEKLDELERTVEDWPCQDKDVATQLIAEIRRLRQQFGNVCAVIHRDGGHRQNELNDDIDVIAKDVIKIVCDERAASASFRVVFDALDANLGLANACLESERKERARVEQENETLRAANEAAARSVGEMKAVVDAARLVLIENKNCWCGAGFVCGPCQLRRALEAAKEASNA
jgi:hypothetical protein